MNWKDELEKKGLFGAALYARKVVKVEDVIIIITSLLKKQRIITAKTMMKDMEKSTGLVIPDEVYANGINAPEPGKE